MEKRWVLIGAVLIGVCLIIIFLVPFFVNADSFRPTVESQLSSSLGRSVTLGRLSFSLMGQSLVAEEIVIADDPAFSRVPFLQAKKLDVGVEILPFLLHREVRLTKLAIDSPSIQLIEHADGKWNYSSLGGSSSKSEVQQPASSVPNLSVDELKIVNGSALVSSIPVTSKPFEYNGVNLTVKQFSQMKSFPFDLSANLPAGGTLKLTGDAGPISQQDVARTPFKAKLELKDLDLVAAGIMARDAGISMDNDVDAQIASDGTTVSSTGKVTASRLQLSGKGTPAGQPVEMSFTASQNLDTRRGNVPDISIQTGSVAVHVSGTFELTPQGETLNLRLSAPGLPIDQLERLLPIVGIRLPSGSSLQGGTLTAEIAITGPVKSTILNGPVEIDNTKLAGFDLGSKIQGLNPLGGTGGGTAIQTLKANVNSSAEVLRITDIYGNLPQLGTATGQGTVEPSGALNFDLTAKLNSSNAVGAIANSALNSVGGLAGSLLHPGVKQNAAGGRGIPLTITGTATNPTIRANMGALLK